MSRNMRVLHNFEPATSDREVRVAAVQFVREVSGSTRPSRANTEVFDPAVDAIALATRRLLDVLVTTAPPRDREREALKGRERHEKWMEREVRIRTASTEEGGPRGRSRSPARRGVSSDTLPIGNRTACPDAVAGVSDLLKLSADAADLLFRQARTANTFTDEPVSEEQMEAIQDLVKYGPTAMNSQPLRVILIRSEDARSRLVKHMADGNRDKTATAPLVAVLAADTNFNEHLPTVFPYAEGAKDWFPDPAAREATARLNAGLQIGYFILGVRAAGLAAGPMTGFDAEAIDEDLLTGMGLRTMVVVNIGHPGENAWFDRLPRLGHDQVVTTL